MIAAWNDHRIYALGFVAAFYGTMLITLAGFILLVGTARFLGSHGQRALIGLSALLLVGLGIYLLFNGVRALAGT